MSTQNRQFQWSHLLSFIYPPVTAMAATLLAHDDFEVIWNDGIAEKQSCEEFLRLFESERPHLLAVETKMPVIKQHWGILDGLKSKHPDCQFVLMSDHVATLLRESMERNEAL